MGERERRGRKAEREKRRETVKRVLHKEKESDTVNDANTVCSV